MARAAINQMLNQNNDVIVNIVSVSGVTGSASAIDYSAAKSGLVGLTKSLVLLGVHIMLDVVWYHLALC